MHEVSSLVMKYLEYARVLVDVMKYLEYAGVLVDVRKYLGYVGVLCSSLVSSGAQ